MVRGGLNKQVEMTRVSANERYISLISRQPGRNDERRAWKRNGTKFAWMRAIW